MIFVFLSIALSFQEAVRIKPRSPIVSSQSYKKFDNSIACDICNKAINYIYKLLEDKKIEEEIIEAINELCVQYPAPYDTLCSEAVAKYVPIIITWLEEGIKIADVCAKIGICAYNPEGAKGVRFTGRHVPNNNGFGCDMCTKSVEYIAKLLESEIVEDEIAKLVEQYCQQYESPYSGLCNAIVETSIPVIIKWINEGLMAIDICTKIGLCTANTTTETTTTTTSKLINKARPVVAKNNNDLSCDMCTAVVKYIKSLLDDKKVEDEITKLVISLCEQYPSPYDTICTSTVSKYIPLIIEYLKQGLVSTDICSKIGLCGTTFSQKSSRIHKSKSQLVVRKTRTIAEVRAMFPKNDNGLGCAICNRLVDTVDQFLEDPNFQASIQVLLDEFCNGLSSLYKAACLSVVDSMLPTIADWIENQFDSLQICVMLGLCDNTTQIKQIASTRRQIRLYKTQLRAQRNNGDTCTICTITVNFIDTKMKDSDVQRDIINAVFGFCSTLSFLYDPICKVIASTYVPLVMRLISDGVETLDICNKLGFCTSNEIVYRRQNFRRPLYLPPISSASASSSLTNQNGLCESCRQTIREIEEMLADKKIEEEIIEAVKEICRTFPVDISMQCDLIADHYIPLIITLIQQGLESLDICNKIGFCSSKKSLIKYQGIPSIITTNRGKRSSDVPKIKLPTKNYDNSIGCDMCNNIVEYIENLLKEHYVQEEITQMVLQVCNLMPVPFDGVCKDMLNEYVQLVVQWIEQGLETADICHKIGLC